MADTNPWVVAVPAAIAGGAAILGGYLAARHQLKAQREDRQEARAERRRDRRDEEFRQLADLTHEVTDLYAQEYWHLSQGKALPEELARQLLSALQHLYASTARIGDAQLTEHVNIWVPEVRAWAKVMTPQPAPEVADAFKAIHDRVGELIRRTLEEDEIAKLEAEIAQLTTQLRQQDQDKG